MSQRIHSYLSGWEWHILQHTTPSKLLKLYPDAAEWILNLDDKVHNSMMISQIDQHTVVQGSLMLQLSEDKHDLQPFHFWLSASRLITVSKDNRVPIRLQNIDYTLKYEQCQTAPEAFCIMMNILLEYIHIGLDHFQTKLGELEHHVRMHNRKDLLDEIIERRYELLHYNHLYLPYRELEGMLKEAFLDDIQSTKSFIRLQHRFERLDTLLKHYAIEIDTLLSVDDAISSMRGNEIIRTLTIFTVLCLPATILGAIWGSNFDWLPFKDEPLGFFYLIISIFFITACLSYLLWRKGWTGDIISSSKRKSKVKVNQIGDKFLVSFKQTDQLEPLTTHIESTLPPRKERKKIKRIKKATVNLKYQAVEELPSRSKRRK